LPSRINARIQENSLSQDLCGSKSFTAQPILRGRSAWARSAFSVWARHDDARHGILAVDAVAWISSPSTTGPCVYALEAAMDELAVALKVIFVDEPDDGNPLGIKGVGEIGIVGVAAAIANAVHHATGKRVRDLPITLDKVQR
jgi:hypothetical protein